MRKLFVIILLAMLSATVSAQNTDAVRESLAKADSVSGARVNVYESPSLATAVDALEAKTPSATVYGYRVGVFMDNSQSARGAAYGTAAEFSQNFPSVTAKVVYENPYWKVIVGNCLTSEEAITLLGIVQQKYPKSFLTRGNISIYDLNK